MVKVASHQDSKGWLHLAHGVRGCAAGLRYVLYMYMTSWKTRRN